MRKLNVLDTNYNKNELYIPILDGKTYLYWFETDPTNEELTLHEMYPLWKKQYDYLKSIIEVSGYTYIVGAKTVYDTVAYDVNGNAISYFDIFNGAKTEVINGYFLDAPQLVTNGELDSTTSWDKAGTATYSVSNGIMTFLAASQYQTVRQVAALILTKKYYWCAKVKATSNAVYAGLFIPGVSTSDVKQHSGGGNYELLSSIYTYTSEVSGIALGIWDARASAWDNIFIDYIYRFNISRLITNKQYSPLFDTTFDLMSDANIKSQMDAWILDGTLPNALLDVVNPEIESVGKNLLDKNDFILGGYLSATDTITAEPNSFYTLNHIKVKPNTAYAPTIFGTSISIQILEYDINKKFIARSYNSSSAISVTTSFQTYYVRLSVYTGTTARMETVQLEQGTVATTYEAFISATQKFTNIDGTDLHLRRLPNGVKDTIEEFNNKVQRIGKYVITGLETWALFDSYANVTYIYAGRGIIPDFAIQSGAVVNLKYCLENHVSVLNIEDSLNLVGAIAFNGGANTSIWVGFTKGTSVAAAKAALVGKVIYYELLTPVETKIKSIGYMLGFSKVTYFQNQSLATNFKVNKYTDIFNERIEGPLDTNYDLGWFATEPDQTIIDAWQAMYDILKYGVNIPQTALIIEPVGLGNRFKLLEIDGQVYGHELDFEDISFKINFGINYNAYEGYNLMMNMLRNNKAIIEYDWGAGSRFADVRLLNAPKTEKNTLALIVSKFSFKLLNPFYELIESSSGLDVTNNTTLDLPVIFDLTVTANTVELELENQDSSLIVQSITFDFTGLTTPFNLTINPETKKVLIDGETDAYDYIDHSGDSFINVPANNVQHILYITGATVNTITYKKWVIA
jgi:hypothetical protein